MKKKSAALDLIRDLKLSVDSDELMGRIGRLIVCLVHVPVKSRMVLPVSNGLIA